MIGRDPVLWLFTVNTETRQRLRSDSTLSLRRILMVRLPTGGKYYPHMFGFITHRREIFRRYPKMDLMLMAPIQLENLLPYNLEYRIYDKDTDQNWRSYLRAGGIMPIHSVELSHLVLLNIEINDTSS